ALRRLSGLGPPLPRLCLALEPLGLLDAAICLGSDPLLLALDFGDLVLHPLFGDRWVVAALGGNRWRHRARLWRGPRGGGGAPGGGGGGGGAGPGGTGAAAGGLGGTGGGNAACGGGGTWGCCWGNG